MYTAASMPGETGPVASASLGSAIENGGRERLGQLWHPASKCRTATERLSVCGTGRHQSRDGLASIRNRDFVPLSNLSNQCRQVLPGFPYSCFFHPVIVLHVALTCNGLQGLPHACLRHADPVRNAAGITEGIFTQSAWRSPSRASRAASSMW